MSRLNFMFYMMMESLNIDEVKNWKGSLRGKKRKDGKDPILKAIKELLTPSIFFCCLLDNGTLLQTEHHIIVILDHVL
jgi:hypothetical protein